MRLGIERASQARDVDLAGLAELEERLAAAQDVPSDADPSTAERDRLALVTAEARTHETETRLAVRTGEERARALAGRADELDRAAIAERRARDKARARRERAVREAAVASAVVAGARRALGRIESSLTDADGARSAVETERAAHEQDLIAVRQTLRDLGAELALLTDSVHRDEVARAEQRLRIEQIEQRSIEELGVDAETLLAEYGPGQLVPPSPSAPGDPATPDAEPTVYDRETQTKRLRAAERALALLGRVNPLALEEFSALEERHQFLTEQLEDLKKTRRDLLDIVREVDDRVEEVFSAAYADVAREFEIVFARLFPGGSCSPILRTCWPPASTSRRARRGRRSSASRCFPVASGR
jgi:chromosome segregation protein